MAILIMKTYLARSPLGYFLFDEKGRFLRYSKKEEEFEKLKPIPDNRFLRENFRQVMIRAGLAKNDREINLLLSRIGIELVKQRLRRPNYEQVIKLLAGTIEQLDKNLNSFSERLREWYGLHFPEFTKAVKDAERMVELIAKYGKREKIKGFESQANKSAGMEFSEQDLKAVREWASCISRLYHQRKQLFGYLEDLSRQVMPNLTALAGPFLAAKLLEHAGSLEKLARLPVSTIQLLGAEKALFRHLKAKAKVPKHGIIFLHPLIQQAKPELRGKIARILAAKLSLAAKIDYFSKEDRSKELKKALDDQISRLSV